MGNPLYASNVLLRNIIAGGVPQGCLCREALASAALGAFDRESVVAGRGLALKES
jgi:hypothetical protein